MKKIGKQILAFVSSAFNTCFVQRLQVKGLTALVSKTGTIRLSSPIAACCKMEAGAHNVPCEKSSSHPPRGQLRF
jgi:hypothetical protein